MKTCPTCNKTYTDEHLSFCIEDGTPLVPVVSKDRTIPAAPHFKDDSKTDDRAEWNASPYQPPSYVPPGAGPKRKVWPWILGIAGVLILAFAGIAVALAIIVPRMVRNNRTSRETPPPAVQENENTKPNDKATANSNSANSNSATSDESKSDESKSDSAKTDAPTDPDLVLAQLTNLEHEWTVANINADKKALSKILADDYAGSSQGQIQGKADYLKNLQRDTTIQKWEFQNLKVNLRGDRATLTGRLLLKRQDQDASYSFVDKFVWRDGRWQATGSEVSLNSDKLM